MSKERLGLLITIISALVVATLVAVILRYLLGKLVRTDNKTLAGNPTGFIFLKNSMFVIAYALALMFIFYKVDSLKGIGKALFASAGILAAIIGFASQKAFSNIIGGLFILFFKPFRVGDQIEVPGKGSGIVEELTIRHTVIRDFENKRIIIPNAIISEETVLNTTITDARILRHIVFSISYDSSIDLARKIIQEEAMAHENFRDYRNEEAIEANDHPVPVRVIKHGDSSIDLKAWVWSDNPAESFLLYCDILESIKKRFDAEGVVIPFPHRTIVSEQSLIK